MIIVMVGFLKPFLHILKVIMVAVVENKSKVKASTMNCATSLATDWVVSRKTNFSWSFM